MSKPRFLSVTLSAGRVARGGILLVLMTLFLAVDAVGAQQLRFETETRIEMGGMLGALAGAMGDLTDPTIETTLVGDGVVRTDSEKTSTILRLGEGSMVQIDHDAGTWYRYDFGDFDTMMEQMNAEAEREASSTQTPEVTGDFAMDRTNQRRDVNGFNSEQVLMTMQLEANDQAQNPSPMSGRMVMLIESWMSSEFADHPALQSMTEEARNFVRNGAEFGMGNVSASMMGDPRLGEALLKFQEDLQELQGMPVRTTSLIMILPEGADFDRGAAIEQLSADLSSDGPSLEELMSSGGGDAARAALGRFGFGGGSDESDEAPAPAQQALMRMVQEITNIESVTLDPSTFDPPADYREVESPMRGIGGR